MDGPISIEHQDSSYIKIFKPQPVAKIIGCRVHLRFENAPYDQVTSGELVIRGYLRAVAIDFKNQNFRYNYAYDQREPERKIRNITLDDPIHFWQMTNPESLSPELSCPTTLWCLPLYMVFGEGRKNPSMVRGIALVQSSKTQYQRVGWFHGDAGWCYRERSKERDILIV